MAAIAVRARTSILLCVRFALGLPIAGGLLIVSRRRLLIDRFCWRSDCLRLLIIRDGGAVARYGCTAAAAAVVRRVLGAVLATL